MKLKLPLLNRRVKVPATAANTGYLASGLSPNSLREFRYPEDVSGHAKTKTEL